MNKTRLAWAAGLVDGEGCIHGTKNGTITLTVSMCDAESLWRFSRIFQGSSMRPWRIPRKKSYRASRSVSLSGANALRAIRLMSPYLSSVKLADLKFAQRLAPNAGKGANYVKRSRTTCAHGHPYTKQNTYIYDGLHGAQRICITCKKAALRRWYNRNKHTKFWRKYR